MTYFKRDGTPYANVLEWAADFKRDHHRNVDRTRLWWGGLVSTVWDGLDSSAGFGNDPRIFETALFGSKFTMLEKMRSSTETEAKVEHAKVVFEASSFTGFLKLLWKHKLQLWRES